MLLRFPGAQEQNDGKNIIHIFQVGMEQILKHALNTDYESEAMILGRAANIIRKINSTPKVSTSVVISNFQKLVCYYLYYSLIYHESLLLKLD